MGKPDYFEIAKGLMNNDASAWQAGMDRLDDLIAEAKDINAELNESRLDELVAETKNLKAEINALQVGVTQNTVDHEAVLAKLKELEEEMGINLVACEQCKELYEPEIQGVEYEGMSFCSTECKEDYIKDEGYCVMCDGTGEGQWDGSSCRACKGKGFIRSACHDDF